MYYIYIEGVQFSNMGYASVMSWLLFIYHDGAFRIPYQKKNPGGGG